MTSSNQQVADAPLEDFVQQRGELAKISSKSFIVTVFGDVVSQHGGWIWLGSLIESLETLGYSERLVRTSVFRLVKDNWLKTEKRGRKSYYAFTDYALSAYTKATRRIYAGTRQNNDNQWLLLLPTFVDESQMPSLRRQLRWMGFSPIANGTYAHPSMERASLEETLKEMALFDSVVLLQSRTLDLASDKVLRRLVQQKWHLDELAQDYREILQSYQPVIQAIQQGESLSDREQFLLRNLLIHEYRRLLLKDHELPENMLPKDWPGYAVNQLVKKLYAKLGEGSQRYIVHHLYNQDGYLPKAGKEFSRRFGI